MIDPRPFATGMEALSERFRGEMSATAQAGYYAILSEHLTTEEFRVAVQLAFRHSQFWPSPQQLIEFAKPPVNLEDEAVEMFDKVLALGVYTPSGTMWPRDQVVKLGQPAIAGYIAIGANEGLKNLKGERMSFARRDFVKAYVSRAKRTQAQQEIHEARQLLRAPRKRAMLPSGEFGQRKPSPIGEVIEQVVGANHR